MYFGIIEDERDPYTITHSLVDILKLVMIAILCGMDELDKIIDYGKKQTVKSSMFNCLLSDNLLLEVIGNNTIL